MTNFVDNEPAVVSPSKPIYSIISPQQLAQFVSENFTTKVLNDCIFWCQGINDTYKLKLDNTELIVRVYRHQWRNKEAILFEIDALNFLNERVKSSYVSCVYPTLLQTTNEETIQDHAKYSLTEYPASEGDRFVIMTSAAEGNELNLNDLLSVNVYAKTLARLHIDTNHFISTSHRSELDSQHLLIDTAELIKPYLTNSTDLAWFSNLVINLNTTVSSLNKTSENYGFCHGDYNGVNAHIKNNKITLFDFDCCGLGYRIYDLATFKWACISNGLSENIWISFLNSYLTYRELTKEELSMLDDFVLIRQIWVMGLHCQTAIAKGWLSEKYFNFHINQLKRWQCNDFKSQPYIY